MVEGNKNNKWRVYFSSTVFSPIQSSLTKRYRVKRYETDKTLRFKIYFVTMVKRYGYQDEKFTRGTLVFLQKNFPIIPQKPTMTLKYGLFVISRPPN